MAPAEDPSKGDPEPATASDREGLVTLIRAAFAKAKETGKDDWQRMYAGVLKNRMLLLTDDGFDEASWGAPTFTSLLEGLPELLRIDRSVRPPIVELLEPDQVESVPRGTPPAARHPPLTEPEATSNLDPRRWRIRRDLWEAVLGIHASDAFMWEQQAVVRVPLEPASNHPGVRLPTLTGDELDAWQVEFAADQPTDARYVTVLASWARGETPTKGLPRHLEHLWYARLKDRVRSRLEEWFQRNGISLPDDLIQVPSRARTRVPESGSLSALRTLVAACVDVMTEAELREMRLPPDVVLRSQR